MLYLEAMALSARFRLTLRVAALCLTLAIFTAVALAWRWTALAQWLQPSALLEAIHRLQDLPFAPAAVFAAYIVGGFLVVPITLMIVVTAMAFDPWPAIAYALSGSLASAAVSFVIGSWLGRDAVRRLAGARVNRISRRFASGGFLSVAMLRLFPLAPFTVVNVVAGASQVGLLDFLAGTFIAETPGIVLIVAFVHGLSGAVREPSLGAFASLTLALAGIIGLAMAVKRRVAKRSARAAATSAERRA